MLTRITNRYITNNFISQITQQRNLLETARQQISTGQRVADPSDDPAKSGVIIQLRSTLERLNQHKDRISLATGTLVQQEQTLNSAHDIMVRAKELATQAANGSVSTQVRNQMADEVFALRDQLVALGNTKYDGRYIYGAANDDSPPFVADSYTVPATGSESIRYVYEPTAADGGQTTREVTITDSEKIRVNTPGDQVFSGGIAALEQLGRAMKGFRTTIDGGTGLPDGGGTAYTFPGDQAQQLALIQSMIDEIEESRAGDISNERSSVGTRLAQADQATQSLEALILNTEQTRAALQDIDILSAASNLAALQTNLEALLAAGARVNQLSLLNFI